MTGQVHPRTTITYEYPEAEGAPYYPVPREENQALYKRYESLALAVQDVYFAGRLATYRYYNMDQVRGTGSVNLPKDRRYRCKNSAHFCVEKRFGSPGRSAGFVAVGIVALPQLVQRYREFRDAEAFVRQHIPCGF